MEMINSFIRQSIKVFRVSYRPKSDEFWMIAKITGLGILLIGFIGFAITVVFAFINSMA